VQGIDVTEVIDALGLDYDILNNEASALCPGHYKTTGKADHSPSWWINLDTGFHMCFSCGYKGNLLQLICDVRGLYLKNWLDTEDYDYESAKSWLASVAEISIEKLLERLKELPTYVYPSIPVLEMSEARLAVFVDPPEAALQSRTITPEAATKYGVQWDANKSAWILPLREPHFNKLMGWQEKGTLDRTFFNRPAGLQKSKTLFGVENQNEDVVIVVESPLDCVRIASAGIDGAVAICGSSVSEEQVKLLRFSSKIIAAFDNPTLDSAGKKASKEMLEWARKYGLNLFFFNYGSSGKKDPGDMSVEEIQWGVANAKSSLYGESAYVQGNA
jgi:5S rRNA maturation endonuclease (ribonuclease M5)